MFRSLRTRITLISLLSGMIISLGLVVAGTKIISKLISDDLINHSRLAAAELVSQINRLKAFGLRFDDIIDFDEQCRLVLSKDEKLAFAGVYDKEGRLRFKSSEIELTWSSADAIILDAGHQEQLITTDKYLVLLHPIEPEAALGAGYVVVAVDRTMLQKATFDEIGYFIIIAAVLVLISLTLHFMFLRRSVIQPLGRLVRAVKSINPEKFNGELDASIANEGEISELAQSFTKLLSQLATAQNEALAQASRAIDIEKKLRVPNKMEKGKGCVALCAGSSSKS
jgi:HAMP domain-containing protein